MSEPSIAEISMFAGNFAPRGRAFSTGALLPISQNTALFSIVGTTYGGDGRTTLALPDLQGRTPVHAGRGPGLPQLRLGQKGGTETVTLTESQVPSHNHTLAGTVNAFNGPGNQSGPAANYIAGSANAGGNRVDTRFSTNAPNAAMAANAVEADLQNTGGSQAHNNMQPYLCLSFIIALVGLYPSRS